MRKALGIAMLWLSIAGAVHAAGPLRPFDAASLAALRVQHAGKPFVLAFWSVTCEPCRDDMRVFKAAQRRHPGIPIHLVAADPPGSEAEIERFLKRFDPGPVTRWSFADEFSERVRYSVDPGWRGELPRTYLYDAKHAATALTGKVDVRTFEGWLSGQAADPGRSKAPASGR